VPPEHRTLNRYQHVTSETTSTPPSDSDETRCRHDAETQRPGRTAAQTSSIPSTRNSLPTGWERYQLLDEIGKGGCGVVARAFDRQLQRDVVVKRILPTIQDDEDLQQRFWHEALITGGLEHPGVAPVYEVGRDARSHESFYAMKWLKGETLAEAIRRLHHSGAQRLDLAALRELLDRFVGVCQTLAYAHQQNVIHRDIKSANIILGEFGETVLLDWGIAKRFHSQHSSTDTQTRDASQSLNSANPGTIIHASISNDSITSSIDSQSYLSSENSASLTQLGALLGTPSAMSPEQASGEVDSLDPRSDIFSLGSLLYEILTGVPAFRDSTLERTLDRVRKAEFVPVRTRQHRVPRALAAVCEKAMRLDRESRYQSAAELAAEVKRFLAGDRVRAYAEPWWAKADRWIRKHRTITWSILISLSLLTLTTSIAIAVVRQAHSNERSARVRETVAHRETLKQLKAAREASDAWLLGISGDLQYYPGLSSLRSELLQKAHTHYAQLAEVDAETLAGRVEKARALIRLGDLCRLLDQHRQSEVHFQQAVSLLSTTTTTQHAEPSIPGDELAFEVKLQTANALLGLALLPETSANVSPVESLKDAKRLLLELQLGANSSELQNALTRAAIVEARQLVSAEQVDAAIDVLKMRLAQTDQLLDLHQDARHRHLYTTLLNELGTNLQTAQRASEAAEQYEELCRVYTLESSYGIRPDLLEGRAAAKVHQGNCFLRLGESQRGAECFKSAVDDYQNAWQLIYGDAYYSENLAIALANLSQATAVSGNTHDATATYREAIDWLREAIQSDGANAGRVERMVHCYLGLSSLLIKTNDAEADTLFTQTQILIDHLKSTTPDSTEVSTLEARLVLNQATQAWMSDNPSDGEERIESWKESIALSPELDRLMQDPEWLRLRHQLTMVQAHCWRKQHTARRSESIDAHELERVQAEVSAALAGLEQLSASGFPASREICFEWQYIGRRLNVELHEALGDSSREVDVLRVAEQWTQQCPESAQAWYVLAHELRLSGKHDVAQLALIRAEQHESTPSVVGAYVAKQLQAHWGSEAEASEAEALWIQRCQEQGERDWLLETLRASDAEPIADEIGAYDSESRGVRS
jgi:serine/threonine protein kinase